MKAYAKRNANVRQIGFRDYKHYLKSMLWKAIRRRVLSRNPECVACHRKPTQVHHKKYNRSTLDGTTLAHLVSLCSRHHKMIEFDRHENKLPLHRANQQLEVLRRQKSLH